MIYDSKPSVTSTKLPILDKLTELQNDKMQAMYSINMLAYLKPMTDER